MPTLKGTEASLSYVQCFLYLVSSSINVSYFSCYMTGYLLNRLYHILLCIMHAYVLCALYMGLLYPWYVVFIPIYNAHPYFSVKKYGEKACKIHGKVRI